MRVDQPDELARDLTRQHHPDDVHRLRGRDAQAAAELGLDAEPVEHRGDLRPAAVHDDGAQPDAAQEDHVLRERTLELVVDHGVAAVLHDDERAAEPLEPREGLHEDLGLLVGAQAGAGVEARVGGRQVGRCLAHVEYALFSWT
ncbi:hypothetical protein GCM10025864_40890 [Luteimicrobium album]|uniref:Uncharacterized protein n=1 Tax=Luteimicrobium album TaxID=1054550 RepID=A0ABQ6I729_9MICO|nr:hypothetical protein GCM10025864_40890 [Luteimicrobium album]